VIIRPAAEPDLGAIVRVWQAAWFDGHRGHVPDALLAARQPDYFVAQAERRVGSTLVAIGDDGEIVGVAIIDGAELWQLGIADTARGTGVARSVLTAVERRIGVEHPQAWLAVVPGNTRARAFYAKCGWRDLGPSTYDALTLTGDTVPVPIHRYAKDLTGAH
jgi:ribosomal protein S18 acetylase RimI-like enzyme